MSKDPPPPKVVIGDDLGALPKMMVDFAPTEYFIEQFGTAEAQTQLENFVRDSTVRHLGKAAQAPKASFSDIPGVTKIFVKDTSPQIPEQVQTNALLFMGASFLLGALLVYLLVRK